MTGLRATATFATALNTDSGAPSDFLVLPAGKLRGRDGREFLNDRPDAIVAAFSAGGVDLPIDLEHATELKAPKGEPAPAHGWIKQLDIRDGALHARVEWTEDGARLVASKAYRYVSPALLFERAGGRVVQLTSVGLTNRPNLETPALNSETKETSMNLAAICAALGIAQTSTDADVVAAVNTLRRTVEQPDPSRFVPKADLEAALNRATTAEQKLTDVEKAGRDTKIAALIEGAVKDGKIAPASKDHYTALCHDQGGLERVEQLVASLPKLAAPSGLDHRKADDPPAGGLTDAQKAICRQLGLDEKDFAKSLTTEGE